jgi:hypothetical protein
VPGDVLRMIEDAADNDPVELQSGFTAYDDCSSISTIEEKIITKIVSILVILLYFLFSLSFVENDDECVTASEVYSCGREREPIIVNAILNSEKGNATVVSNMTEM